MHNHQSICVLGRGIDKAINFNSHEIAYRICQTPCSYHIKDYLIFLTCSAVGLVSGSFCKQASTKEQNSGENLFFNGDGDGSSRICHKTKYNYFQTEEVHA